jgi:serine/threonine protein kinase/GAF domain-containing protein
MPPEQFGPYRLEELIGQGGMGEIYRAFDTVKERMVALKRLPLHLATDADFQARFRRESKVAAQLREAHVIPIHDFGEINGQLFLDMRLVEGVDLAALLVQRGALPPARAVNIVWQIACALDAAHAEGLVHRDVKPSNVLISGSQEDYVYLVDFGIARTAAGTSLTGTGATIGTLDYMAPERLLDGHGDHRVDVYSLACLLYETLTARKPFTGEGLPALMYAHVTLPPPAPSTQQPGIPAGLDEVVARGMAKDPQLRYPSAGDLAAAARDALDPPTSTPAGPLTDDMPATGDRLPGDSTTAQALPSREADSYPTSYPTRPAPAPAPAETRVLPPPAPLPPPRRSRGQGIALIVLGLLLLVVGVVVPFRPVGIPVISVLGFPTMFVGAVIAIFGGASPGRLSAGNALRSALAQRMVQRFRRRFEDDPIPQRIRSTTRCPQQDQQAADHRRSPMIRSLTTKIVLAVGAVTILIVVIGAASQSTPSQPIQSAPGTYPTRVSYATACLDLNNHVTAGAELVQEFINDPQRLANRGAATTERFDALIGKFEYYSSVGPTPLVRPIEGQIKEMRYLRDYLHVGGTRNNDFQEYKSTGHEIINQCLAAVTTTNAPLPAATIPKSEYPKEVSINSVNSRFRSSLGGDRGKTVAVQLAPGIYSERGSSPDLGTLEDYSSYYGLCFDVKQYAKVHPGGYSCW